MAKRKKKGPPPDPSEFEADIAMLVLQYGRVPEIPTRWAIACLAKQVWIESNGFYGGAKRPKFWTRAQDAKAAVSQYLRTVELHKAYYQRSGHTRVSLYGNAKHTALGYPESWVAVRFSSDKVDIFPIDVFMEKF